MTEVCGTLHRAARNSFRDFVEYDDIFAAGVIAGQAEKVYLGTCAAAMFRPSTDRFDFCCEVVAQIATIYDLRWLPFSYGSTQEVWLLRDHRAEKSLRLIEGMEENSAGWHFARGTLVGIPAEEIDFSYHLRSGFGERCD